jgi:hypothetical protein
LVTNYNVNPNISPTWTVVVVTTVYIWSTITFWGILLVPTWVTRAISASGHWRFDGKNRRF